MNLVTIYGVYGDTLGIELYKYFDIHSLFSSILAQILIALFGSGYVLALLFFVLINVGGYFVTNKIDFTLWKDKQISVSTKIQEN